MTTSRLRGITDTILSLITTTIDVQHEHLKALLDRQKKELDRLIRTDAASTTPPLAHKN